MTGPPVKRLGNALKWASSQASDRAAAREAKSYNSLRRVKEREQRAKALRLLQCLRHRLYNACKSRSIKRAGRTLELLGCTIPELREYLTGLFKYGMTWQNYGEWHVDHIRPCASFNLNMRADQKACFHYTNLQPLWAEDNMWKGKRWQPPAQGPAL